MFKDCTIKYVKDTLTNKNQSIMVIYPENENGISKAMSVPLDEDNTDYQAILEWEKIDGNTIAEAD